MILQDVKILRVLKRRESIREAANRNPGGSVIEIFPDPMFGVQETSWI